MRTDVVNFVKQCITCEQAKGERIPIPGLLQPLPTPKRGLARCDYGLY
jgi:hypothetical protein